MIKKLSKNNSVYEIERLLEEMIEQGEYNSELLLRLALLELVPPIKDYYKSIKCIETILEHEENIYAILVLADIHHNYLGGVNEYTFDKLNSVVVTDNEIHALVEHSKSWYFQDIGKTEEYEKCLLNSIKYCECFVLNNFELGQYYIDHKQEHKGKEYIQRAIDNVMKVYEENFVIEDLTDIEEYINEMYKGIHLSKQVFDWIKSCLDK